MNKIQSALVITILMFGHASVGAAPENSEITALKAVDIKHLIQHWVHSREEQKNPNAEEQIFRPAKSREFPRSRFRMAYKFIEGGNCELMALDPTDRHQFKPAKWEIDAGNKNVLKITANGKTSSFRIVELSEDVLRLAPEKANP